MAATRDNPDIRTKSRTRHAFAIANARTVFAAAMAALCDARHATPSRAGYIEAFSGVAGQFPLGLVQDSLSVDGSGSVGDTSLDPAPRVTVGLDEHEVVHAAVTGLADTQADVGKLVYMSDDATYTLTPPTRPIVFGFIIARGDADGSAWVALFSAFERAVLALAGGAVEMMFLGSMNAASGTGNVRTGIEMPFGGRFAAPPYAIVDVAPTGAGGTGTVNLELNGVDVGGGVITIATGDAIGAKKVGTALTGDGTEVFAKGALLDVEFTQSVAITAGRYDLWAPVIRSLSL